MRAGAGDPCAGDLSGCAVLTLAAGGRVERAPVAEYGMYDADGVPFTVQLTARGKADPLFKGLGGNEFRAFQMHNMTFILSDLPPSRYTLLGTGRHCANQVVKIGSGYGFQSHIEFSLASMEHFTSEVPDFQALGPNLMTEFRDFYPEYAATTRLIVNNFLDIVGV